MSKSITASEKNQSPNAAASPPQPLVSEQETIKELLANTSEKLLDLLNVPRSVRLTATGSSHLKKS
ncbi:hypothetical protein [Ralstonia sp. 25mfcol4.1]|uniref:hypothetical protein n=1 Tax=Ralstonia sp. 25mfcol4.1 TaxID=1761899 RepID=UPI001587EA93|nr:hypothetical protein [Ralstonia sp. 25mfcol4.1]